MSTSDPLPTVAPHVGPTPAAQPSFVQTAGGLCVAGAVIGVISGIVTGFIPPAVSIDRFSYPYTPTGFVVAEVVFILNHVLLLAGILGLARSGAAGTARLGRIGPWLSVVGMATLTVCEVWAMSFANSAYPTASTDVLEMSFGMASILIGVGLVLAGIAVVRAGSWVDWRRFVTLACGSAVFVIVIPGIFGPFLAGRLAITVWMLMFAALGVALLQAPPRDGSVTS